MPLSIQYVDDELSVLDSYPLRVKVLAAIKARNVGYLEGVRKVEEAVGTPEIAQFLQRQITNIKAAK